MGAIPWGTHVCQFYEGTQDLLDALTPYYKAGLANREHCMWLIDETPAEQAALAALVLQLDGLAMLLGQMRLEIRPARQWYLTEGRLDADRLFRQIDERIDWALRHGFTGLRLAGSTAWVASETLEALREYEARLDAALAGKRVVALCLYPLAGLAARDVLRVLDGHGYVLAHGAALPRSGDPVPSEAAAHDVRVLPSQADLGEASAARRDRDWQLSSLVVLSQNAIRARTFGEVLQAAACGAASILGTEYTVVAELLPAQQGFHLHAGVGWPPGILGSPVPASRSAVGCLIGLDEPMVVPDWQLESRHELPAWLAGHGVQATLAVPIRGRERPWGALAVHARAPRPFSADEVFLLRSVANVIALAVERDDAERARRDRESERGRLLSSAQQARRAAEAALETLSAIHSITDAALAKLTLQDLLDALLARLCTALKAATTSVYLLDASGRQLIARAAAGIPLERLGRAPIPVGAVRLDASSRSSVSDPGWTSSFGRLHAEIGVTLRAGLSTPLVVDGRPIGAVFAAATFAFRDDDLHLLQVVADRVAPAIERARLEETVRAGREQLQALSQRLLIAQEEERRHLAIELHDELGQTLTAVKLALGSLQGPHGAVALQTAIASVDDALQRVKEMALDLRPGVLDDLGLTAALRWALDRFVRETGLEVAASLVPEPEVEPGVSTACFRIVQEALTNVARHARARRVAVRLWIDRERGCSLELTVSDDGAGFDVDSARRRASAGASMGLLGMQERAALVGGALTIVSRPADGTVVHARFPLAGSAEP